MGDLAARLDHGLRCCPAEARGAPGDHCDFVLDVHGFLIVKLIVKKVRGPWRGPIAV